MHELRSILRNVRRDRVAAEQLRQVARAGIDRVELPARGPALLGPRLPRALVAALGGSGLLHVLFPGVESKPCVRITTQAGKRALREVRLSAVIGFLNHRHIWHLHGFLRKLRGRLRVCPPRNLRSWLLKRGLCKMFDCIG